MIFLSLPSGAQVALFHLEWSVLAALAIAVVKAARNPAVVWGFGGLSTIVWVLIGMWTGARMPVGDESPVLFPLVVAWCMLVSAMLPWQRRVTIPRFLATAVLGAVVGVAPVPILMIIGLAIEALMGLGR